MVEFWRCANRTTTIVLESKNFDDPGIGLALPPVREKAVIVVKMASSKAETKVFEDLVEPEPTEKRGF